jgi:hypothetical protein
VIVPGLDVGSETSSALHEWADDRGLKPHYIHADTAGRFPLDATLSDLAHQQSIAAAQFDAKALEYPADHLNLTGPGWPVHMLLAPLALALVGLGVAIAFDRWLSRRLETRRWPKAGTPGDSQSGTRERMGAVASR